MSPEARVALSATVWLVLVTGLIALAVIGITYRPLLRRVATFLMVEDPLEPAAAIVLLGGELPFRAFEAARLFQAGWAPQIVLVRGHGARRQAARQALQELNLDLPESWEQNRTVLMRLGVPAAAIRMPEEKVIGGTLEELQIVARFLPPQGGPIILVTSKFHTRRVRMTWRYVTGGKVRSIIRIAEQDPFDPQRWWQHRSYILPVVREYLGLVNYALGFPVSAQENK